MSFFEQELQRLVKNCPKLENPVYAGRSCFAELGGDIRVKLQFVTLGYADHYEAVKVTVLNRAEGEVDATLFRFRDIWGSKAVSNPNFRDGVIPHIWTSNGKNDWYVYCPTDTDFRQLAAEVNVYAGVFADRAVVREHAKESVVENIPDLSFETNNHGLMTVEQSEHDSSVVVEVSHMNAETREYDSEFVISPGDFVMLMNYYRYQKKCGNPVF